MAVVLHDNAVGKDSAAGCLQASAFSGSVASRPIRMVCWQIPMGAQIYTAFDEQTRWQAKRTAEEESNRIDQLEDI